MRNIEKAIPKFKMGELEQAAVMQPIWSLLHSRQNDSEWNPNLRGYLKSCIAGRQWPQARLKAANLSSHSACAFCLHDKIEMIRVSAAAGKEGHDWFIDLAKQARTTADATQGMSQKKKTMLVRNAEARMIEEPQQQMLTGVPTGNLMHRNWKCPRLDPIRRSKAEEVMVQMSKIAEEQLGPNHPEGTRDLV